jgi:hypothetical protein
MALVKIEYQTRMPIFPYRRPSQARSMCEADHRLSVHVLLL